MKKVAPIHYLSFKRKISLIGARLVKKIDFPYAKSTTEKNAFKVGGRLVLPKIDSILAHIFQNLENIPTFKVFYGILPGFT